MGIRMGGDSSNGAANQIDCSQRIAGLMGNNAEQVQGIRLVGILCEYLPVKGSGVFETPVLMVLDRNDQLGNRIGWRAGVRAGS
jgi:hypothetical protein